MAKINVYRSLLPSDCVMGEAVDETASHDQVAHKIRCLCIPLLFQIAHSSFQPAQAKIKSNWASGRLAISCTGEA